MKASETNNTENKQPKLRNIHDKVDEPVEETPESADIRLKLAAGAILALILFVGIKGTITKASLTSQFNDQEKLLTEARAEALLYGITEDEDGDLIMPVNEKETPTDVSSLEWESVAQRNKSLLDSFVEILLHWEGNKGYDKARQTLMDEWGFAENSQLLSVFMPEDDGDKNMKPEEKYSMYELSNDGKNVSYFLICTVHSTINKHSADGTVGIRLTINEDGTMSNVTAQTLS